MARSPRRTPRAQLAAFASLVCALALVAACNAMLDIDDIEFSDGVPSGGAGGGAGNAGGSGAGGSGAGANGGSGGNPGGEFCTNGLDDDNDGAIDCADSDCSAYRCVAPPPLGWSGPAVLYTGLGTEPLPPCPSAWTSEQDLGRGITSPSHTCSACSCSAPSGGTCSLPHISHFFEPATCATLVASWDAADAGGCHIFYTDDMTDSLSSTTVNRTSSGSCTPSGGVPNRPPVEWNEAGRMCSGAPPDAAGCSGNELCVPAPVAPFGTQTCVFQSGDQTCPAGYPNKTLWYAGYNEGRVCSDCNCSSASGQSCVGTVALHSGNSCAGSSTDVPTNGSCVAFAPVGGTECSYRYTYILTGGSCSESGGSPSGSATESDPHTICCE